MKKIQMVDLRSQYDKIKDEADAAMQEVIEKSAFINGPQVRLLADELEEYLGCRYVIPCGNGTDALQIAMMALDFKPGDEVIVPAFTYIAAVEVIALLGLKPVFADVDPETFQIDTEKIKALITEKTVAIVPVHLFGQCADMNQILEVARKYGLKVIEDAAQSLGSIYTLSGGTKCQSGTMGVVGITSFFPTKTLGCFGDGGALFTNDHDLAEKIRMISSHGQKKKYHHHMLGVNSRLDTIQAALLRVKLKHLDEYLQARQQVAEAYDDAFNNIPQIAIPKRSPESTHVFHQYTIRLESGIRENFITHLTSFGIPTMVYYPIPVHLQAAYQNYGYQAGDFPVAEKLCQEVVSLPIHTEMDSDQLNFIIQTIHNFFR
jgi:UDP-2-acetamido-2-deoxy-ribo-hexuluronate aminotransferase